MKLMVHIAGVVFFIVGASSLYERLDWWWKGYGSDELTYAAFLNITIGLLLYCT